MQPGNGCLVFLTYLGYKDQIWFTFFDFSNMIIIIRVFSFRILHNHAKVSQRPSLVGHKTGPLHLLKALNYQSKSTGNGILHHSSSPAPPLGSYVPDLNSVLQLESPEEQAARLEHKYKLTAAVVHLGDVFSGHFVTYRRVPSINGQRFPDKWLYTSDAQVKRASKSEVLRSDAYMLFYEKL